MAVDLDAQNLGFRYFGVVLAEESRLQITRYETIYRATFPCAKSRFCGIAYQLKAALLHYSRNNPLFKTFSGKPTALDSCRLGCFSVLLGDFPYI